MKNILLLTKTHLKRGKIAALIIILGTAILCLILWSLGTMIADQSQAEIVVGVLDYDNSNLSEDFKSYLDEDLHYELILNSTYEELSTELIDKEISVIIEIPEGFYQKFASGSNEKILITSTDDYENAAYVEAYINTYLSSIQLLSAGANGEPKQFDLLLDSYDNTTVKVSNTAAIHIDKKAVANQNGFINSIGFYLMFIYCMSIFLAFMVLDDRSTGVYNRIKATPVKPVHYIVGTGTYGLLLCFLQVALFCGYIYFMDIDTGIPLSIILLMMCLYSVFTISFTIAVAILLSSKNAMTSIIIGFSTVGCILGGAYFPIDFAPKTLQNLAKILPQYWFMDAFRRLQADVTANIYPNITILVLFALLALLIGAVSFSQNYINS